MYSKYVIMKTITLLFILFAGVNLYGQKNSTGMADNNKNKYATFGNGCFWCAEAVFEEVKGVRNVVSGYAGGTVINPSYREVCTGRTGHAEVVQIEYDPDVVSYQELLNIFFKTHDPTSLNRQGADVGTQYRSVIFYHDENQKKLAEQTIQKLDNSGDYNHKIVTQVEAFKNFYVAEDYHQDYYKKNPDYGYCSVVISPKLKKFKENFSDNLKK